MEIRTARVGDLTEIMRVYRAAKAYMDSTGNSTQWKDGYPQQSLVEADISSQKLYVILDDDRICAAFYFSIGPDVTYAKIYDGAWRSDSIYGVIHRVASDGTMRGVMKHCVAFCQGQIPNLRIDTHENNLTMQNALHKLGFVRCGTIYLENGDARIAYQLC